MISDDGTVWCTLAVFRRRLAESGEQERSWMVPFLLHLRRGKGVLVACDLAGISTTAVYRRRMRDRAFRRAWDEALAESLLGRPLTAA